MTSVFMIALYGSFAQAESEFINKNVSLGVQMAMREEQFDTATNAGSVIAMVRMENL